MPATAEPVIAIVDSPDALRELTGTVLEALLGQPPHRDSDGDFLVPSDHGAFWVLPAPDAPALDLTATVATDVSDTALALLEVNRLNRRDALVQHTLVDATVLAHLRIDCAPFSDVHVRNQVAHFRVALDEAIRTMTETLEAASVEQARRRRKQAVATLTELVKGELSGDTPPLDPAMVGQVCGRDEETVASLLRGTQSQLSRVRRVLATGRGSHADQRKEQLLLRQRQLLRQALHLLLADAACS